MVKRRNSQQYTKVIIIMSDKFLFLDYQNLWVLHYGDHFGYSLWSCC